MKEVTQEKLKVNTNKKWFTKIGLLVHYAIEKKKNAPKVAVLEYIEGTLEDAKYFNYEPNWEKIKRDIRRIWWGSL